MNIRRVFFYGLLIYLLGTVMPGKGQTNVKTLVDSVNIAVNKSSNDMAKVKGLLQSAGNCYDKYLNTADKQYTLAALQLIQEALNISEKIKYIEGSARCYLENAKIFLRTGNTTVGDRNMQLALECLSRKNINEIAKILTDFAFAFPQNDAYPIQSFFLKQALFYTRKSGNVRNEGNLLNRIADMLEKNGMIKEAFDSLFYSYHLQKESDAHNIQRTEQQLSHLYNITGNYSVALKYALDAVENAKKNGDTINVLMACYQQLAFLYNDLKDYKNSRYYFNIIIAANEGPDQRPAVISSIGVVAGTLISENKPAEALNYLNVQLKKYPPIDDLSNLMALPAYYNVYEQNKKYELALQTCKQILTYTNYLDAQPQLKMAAYQATGEAYYNTQQLKKAYDYEQRSLNIALELNALPSLKEIYKILFKIDSARGNYIPAIEYYQNYNSVTDTIYNREKIQQIANMEIKYETNEKQKINTSLLEENKLQQKNLDQNKLTRNLILAESLLLISLLFNRYHIKNRANKKLRAQQEKINTQNEILRRNMLEKEWLVKEIHHRVKNNLQIVISLLNTQSHYINNKEAINAITESRHRMEAMSLIHQKLYQSENTTSVNMKNYIQELTEYLEASFVTGNRIIFTLDVEPLDIDIAQAIPLGLILNETISNSIKYAFADNEQGIIKIAMHKKDGDNVMLEIKDNGRGLPNHFDIAISNSMGMRLITGLAKQIDGVLAITGERGVTTTIWFKQHFIAAAV